MIKAILFDLDGTLVDTLPSYLRSYNQALKKQGVNLTEREIVKACFGKTEETICKELGIPDKTEEFRKTYFAEVKDHFVKGKLFPGVPDFLDLVSEKQIKLGIVSFAYTWYVDKMVKAVSLDKYFKVIIGFNDVKKAKPDPEAALLACNKLEVLPEETVVVGDSKSDILMGKNAGCRAILFYPNSYELFYNLDELKESKPDYIVGDFKKLIYLLQIL